MNSGLGASGGLWQPLAASGITLAASGSLWQPLAASDSLWQPLGRLWQPLCCIWQLAHALAACGLRARREGGENISASGFFECFWRLPVPVYQKVCCLVLLRPWSDINAFIQHASAFLAYVGTGASYNPRLLVPGPVTREWTSKCLHSLFGFSGYRTSNYNINIDF